MSASTLDYARGYVQRGLAVIPVPARAKKPVMKGWELLRLAESELPTHFSDGSNIGILCGVPSGNHVDVDLDVP